MSIITHQLHFTQAQVQAFVEFRKSFEELISQGSIFNPSARAISERWHRAILAVCFISIYASCFICQKEQIFELTEEHAKGFADILAIVEDFQKLFPNLQNDELYKQCFATFELFSGAIKKALKKRK